MAKLIGKCRSAGFCGTASIIFLTVLIAALLLPVRALCAGGIRAEVVKVYDGDTILVVFEGRPEKVRLIGIDCPEVRVNDKFEHDMKREKIHTAKEMLELGQRASEYTRTFCPPGSTVRLETDIGRRDRYGRLLAYVWVRNLLYPPDTAGDKGWDMLNAMLLRAGLARTMLIPPDLKYADDFRELEREARGRRLGMWAK
jgi:micrococcal nuclease